MKKGEQGERRGKKTRVEDGATAKNAIIEGMKK